MTNDQRLKNVLKCLNSAYKADPNAISTMLINVVPCNQKLIAHPDVIVETDIGPNRMATVRALGLINGVLTAAGLPRIATKWSDTKGKNGRYDFVGFVKAGKASQPRSRKNV